MVSLYRKERMEKLLREIGARFIERESGPQSLITIMAVNFDEHKNRAALLISVLPEEKSLVVMEFLNRKKRDFVEYLKSNGRFKSVPFVEFHLTKQELD